MPKLTEPQSVLLAAAAARPDLAVLPPPDTLKVKGAATAAIKPRRRSASNVRSSDNGRKTRGTKTGVDDCRPVRLVITGAGLDAIGLQKSRTQDCDTAAESAPQETGPVITEARRPGGKMGMLLDTVSRPGGASIEDLTVATGWLPHTTRAALTRLRQRGYDVQLGTVGERRAYHLIGTA